MPYTSNEDARRYTVWAQEDLERIAAQLTQVRKLARMGERLTVLNAMTARWDAWSECPVCFPWRSEAGSEHTCGLTAAERTEAAALDIAKHGDRHEKLVNDIGTAHRAWMEVRPWGSWQGHGPGGKVISDSRGSVVRQIVKAVTR